MKCSTCTQDFDRQPGQTSCPKCGADLDAASNGAKDMSSATVGAAAVRDETTAPTVPSLARLDELDFLFSRKRPPTIALVGHSAVGKTFFLTRLEQIAVERGMKLRQRTRDGSVDFAPGDQRPWEKDIQSTGGTVVYSLGRSGRKAKDSLWIIDMRGEAFRTALRSHFRDAREEEVVDFWTILVAAQAFILMTPAARALNLVRDDDRDDLWDLSRCLEPLSAAVHLLDRKITRLGSIKAAVGSLVSMSPNDLGDELDRPRERCRKPVLMALTQADVMRAAASVHPNPNVGAQADQLDADPMLVMGLRSRATFNQLLGWFDYFKVDFVTACDGHAGGTKMDTRRPSYGVWDALDWTKRAIGRTHKGPSAALWRTRYAVGYRTLLDSVFNRALRLT